MKFFINNGDEHLGGHGSLDLRTDCVLPFAKKLLAKQVLLDPFEKQFHLLGAFVQRADGKVRQTHLVYQKDQSMFGFGIFEPDTPQVFGEVLGDLVPAQCNGLSADDADCPVQFGRAVYGSTGAFETGSKVDITSVHHAEHTRFNDQDVQHIHLAHLAFVDVDEGGNRAPVVHLCVQLDGCLGFAKQQALKQAQSQTDRSGVQFVDHVFQIEPQVLVKNKTYVPVESELHPSWTRFASRANRWRRSH